MAHDTRPTKIDPRWIDFGTPIQKQYLKAVLEHGSVKAASEALGRNRTTIKAAIALCRKKAIAAGCSYYFMGDEIPEPLTLKGTTTLYDSEGKRLQWVKTEVRRRETWDILKEVVEELSDAVRGKHRPTKPPRFDDEDLLCIYPMGDPHLGMYAWAEETGEDFDLDIASNDLRAAISQLVGGAPPAQIALIINIGDFFHSDNSAAMTSRSGNSLDVDTRWAKVLRVGARTMISSVKIALQRHQRVIVRNEIGNHDDHTSVALSLIMQAYFEQEPRVEIDVSPRLFWYFRFGDCLLGTTHGDKVKPTDLPGIMASDKHEDWGQTKFRHWLTGHIHHKNFMEFPGCTWESLRTLAARDAYHAGHGYRSGRDMQLIVMHKRYGEIARHRNDIIRVREQE